jgi:hypothetical protein
MTEGNQNIDTHECAISFVPNRVSNKALRMDALQRCLKDCDNANFLCNQDECNVQRENYIVLVERIITSDIKSLHFLNDVVTKHIIHAHSRDLAQKCHMVCISIN